MFRFFEIELAVLTVLILVVAISLLLLRKGVRRAGESRDADELAAKSQREVTS
jgi:hypothetical protein